MFTNFDELSLSESNNTEIYWNHETTLVPHPQIFSWFDQCDFFCFKNWHSLREIIDLWWFKAFKKILIHYPQNNFQNIYQNFRREKAQRNNPPPPKNARFTLLKKVSIILNMIIRLFELFSIWLFDYSQYDYSIILFICCR